MLGHSDWLGREAEEATGYVACKATLVEDGLSLNGRSRDRDGCFSTCRERRVHVQVLLHLVVLALERCCLCLGAFQDFLGIQE